MDTEDAPGSTDDIHNSDEQLEELSDEDQQLDLNDLKDDIDDDIQDAVQKLTIPQLMKKLNR